MEDFQAWRHHKESDLERDFAALVKSGSAQWIRDEEGIILTEQGYGRAAEVVRNHRLWELYLTREADYAADHVHDDAEKIEHLLGEETVRQLEAELNFPKEDPHGKPIPGLGT